MSKQTENNDVQRDRSPLLSGQSFQSDPSSSRHMLFSELPNQSLRDAFVLQEPTIRTNHHTLLTPREHDVRPPMILHEPRGLGPNNRNDDVVLFVTLEGVDVENRILPSEIRGLQGALDRVALGIIGSDNLERFSFSDVAPGHLNRSFHFSLVLGKHASARTTNFRVSGTRTVQLTPFLISFPLLTSTKRQQVRV